MERDILSKRDNVEPEEYPEFSQYVEAINNSYWIHTKWRFTSDISDYNNKLTVIEKPITVRTMICVSQIEVKVKTFWPDIYDIFPKPEINSIGITFGESEVRHERGYKQFPKLLGLEKEFENAMNVPAIKNRVAYLNKCLQYSKSKDIKKYLTSLALFTLLIENASLFGQFAIIKMMNFKRNVLKDTDNLIMDTTKEENIHALFGMHLLTIVREEHPELFDEDFNENLENYKIHKKVIHVEKTIGIIISKNEGVKFYIPFFQLSLMNNQLIVLEGIIHTNLKL
ncbi:MAG: ribonucleotide-diphosphate reductase subunit beta [Nanoarchaeota archaeon]